MFSSYKKNCVCGIYNKREREHFELKTLQEIKKKRKKT